MSIDVGIRVAAGDQSGISKEHFPTYKTYDPDKVVRMGRVDADNQFYKDLERGGVRVSFGGERVDYTCRQYKAGGVNGDPHKTFLAKFDAFTEGMDDRQKLVLDYSISQAGLDLSGLIIGDRGAGVVEHTLVKNDDGSVDLAIHVPKEEGEKAHTGVAYTFRIAPDGSGQLLDLKVGDEV